MQATLQFYFFMICTMAVLMLACKGLLGPKHLYLNVVGLPAAAAGMAVGVSTSNRLDHCRHNHVVVVDILIYLNCGTIMLHVAQGH